MEYFSVSVCVSVCLWVCIYMYVKMTAQECFDIERLYPHINYTKTSLTKFCNKSVRILHIEDK